MRALTISIFFLALGSISGVSAWSGKVFSVNGKTVTVATSDSSKTKTGMIVYIVADGKEVGRGRIGKAFHTKVEISLQSGSAQPGNLVTDNKPAPAAIAKKEEPKPEITPTVNQNSAAAFISFCGLNYGDSEDQMKKIFGAPERIEDEGKNTYDFSSRWYFSEKFHVRVFNGKAAPSNVGVIMSFSVESAEAVQKIKSLGIKDDKLDLWGLTHEEITRRLGKPDDVTSSIYEYKYDVNGKRGIVAFSCYEFWQNKCNQIRVQWLR